MAIFQFANCNSLPGRVSSRFPQSTGKTPQKKTIDSGNRRIGAPTAQQWYNPFNKETIPGTYLAGYIYSPRSYEYIRFADATSLLREKAGGLQPTSTPIWGSCLDILGWSLFQMLAGYVYIYIWLIVYIYIARYSVKSHFLICFRKSIFSTINSTSFDDPTISHLHSEDRLHDSDFSHAPPWAIGAHWGHRFMSLLEKHQTWGINCWTCGEIDQWGPIYGSSHMVLSES